MMVPIYNWIPVESTKCIIHSQIENQYNHISTNVYKTKLPY